LGTVDPGLRGLTVKGYIKAMMGKIVIGDTKEGNPDPDPSVKPS